MLSRHWNEKDFLAILEASVAAATDRPVSTGEFLGIIQRLTGLGLEAFSHRFIESTGLPEILFEYEVGERVDGKWPLQIVARQVPPTRFVHSIVRAADGRLALRREPKAQMRIDETSFVVPFAIPIDAPWPADAKPAPKPRKGEPPARPRMEGRMLVQGAETTARLELEHRPLGVLLDPRDEIFARFFDLEVSPKRSAIRRAREAVSAGDAEGARQAYRSALTAAVRSPNEFLRVPDADEVAREGRELDAWARFGLARLALDAGDLGTARRELVASTSELDRTQRRAFEGVAAILASRLELAEGASPGPVFRRLRRTVLKESWADDAEAWLLLAIAADAAGEAEVLEKAREEAERRGGSLGPLAAPSPSRAKR
jgi:hypothetical protein